MRRGVREIVGAVVVAGSAAVVACYDGPPDGGAPAASAPAAPCSGAGCSGAAPSTDAAAAANETPPPATGADAFDAGAPSDRCPGTDLTAAPHMSASAGALVVGGYGERSAVSHDGLHWTWSAPALAADAGVLDRGILSIAVSDTTLVAAAGSGILSSTDGRTWTPRPVPNVSTYVAYDNGFEAAAYGNGAFVVAASAKFNDLAFYRSTDGVTWTDAPFVVSGTCCRPIHAIAFGGGKFVGVGAARRTIVSDDGITWHDDKLGGADEYDTYTAIAYGNGTWVAVGPRSVIAWSTNGVDWNDASQPAMTGDFHAVAFDGAKFVTCSRWACYTSADGKTWTQGPGASTDPRPTVAMAHAGGVFVGIDVPARILTSNDGLAWIPVACGAPPEIRALGFAPSL